jgi:hypothetical protein
MNPETAIMKAIREAICLTRKASLWRNNVGLAKTGNGATIAFGLGKGSPDLVGFLHGSARLFCIEAKTATGRLSPEQRCWLRAANSNGAYAAVARSPEEALDHLARAVAGEPGPEIPEPKKRAA